MRENTANETLISNALERMSNDAVDIRSVILMLAVYSVSIFFVRGWFGILAFAILLIVGTVLLGASGNVGRVSMKVGIPIGVILFITVVLNALEWGDSGLTASLEGLTRGLFFASRILLIVWASMVAMATVRPDRIGSAISSLLSPLARLKVPVDDIAMACSVAIRFIPTTFACYGSIKDAQWSRGTRFDEGPISGRVRSHVGILAPMLASSFRSAEHLSSAMEARCYGSRDIRRTNLHSKRLHPVQIAVTIGFCASCIALCVVL